MGDAERVVMARILLCEADPDVRHLLAVMLDRLGHEPVPLRPGEPAPAGAELLVLEPAAPAYLALAREARRHAPTLPVVCVSVLPEEADFLSLGPLGYLTKPFTLDELRSAVEVALAAVSQAA